MISSSDTIVYPRAVVIESINAIIAFATMASAEWAIKVARWTPFPEKNMAVESLGDMIGMKITTEIFGLESLPDESGIG